MRDGRPLAAGGVVVDTWGLAFADACFAAAVVEGLSPVALEFGEALRQALKRDLGADDETASRHATLACLLWANGKGNVSDATRMAARRSIAARLAYGEWERLFGTPNPLYPAPAVSRAGRYDPSPSDGTVMASTAGSPHRIAPPADALGTTPLRVAPSTARLSDVNKE